MHTVQYGVYTIQDDNGTAHHVNGKLTLGENMADNAGLLAAYQAWKARVKKTGEEVLRARYARSSCLAPRGVPMALLFAKQRALLLHTVVGRFPQRQGSMLLQQARGERQ